MTDETKFEELNQYSQDIIKVLDDILEIIGTTKLIVSFDLSLDEETIEAEGLFIPKNVVCFKGQSFGSLPIPVRPGWEFMGWYTFREINYSTNTETYKNLINYSDEVIYQGKITLYAKWEREKHKVYLDPGEYGLIEGDCETEIDTGKYYTEVRLSAGFGALPKASYAAKKFDDWVICSPYGLETYAKNAILLPEMLDEDGNAYLTAEYTNDKTSVYVEYIYGSYRNSAGQRLNGGIPVPITEGGNPVSAVFTDVELNVKHNVETEWAPTLRDSGKYNVEGYTFAGLALTKYCTSEAEAEKTYIPFDVTRLYAVWNPGTYEIRYYGTTNDKTLLKIQKVTVGEVDEILDPEELFSDPIKSRFKCWKKFGIQDGLLTSLVAGDVVPGTPICDVCKNGGYVKLSAEYSGEGYKDTTLLSNLQSDWSHIYPITEKIYETGSERIELADYRMYIFDDIRTTFNGELSDSRFKMYSKIPTSYSIKSRTSDLAAVEFKYGELANSFKTTYNVKIKKPRDSIRISLLSDNFNNVFRYKSKLDLADLSVVETAMTIDGEEIQSKIYDYTNMIYKPISSLNSRLMNDFDLSVEFRSREVSWASKQFTIPIKIWCKPIGLSVIEPEVKPALPVGMAFDKNRDFNMLKVAIIKENNELATKEDSSIYYEGVNHMSVLNLPDGSEILPESPKKLRICSCDTDGVAYPEISCIYYVNTEECQYTAKLKNPDRTSYSRDETLVNLSGISAELRYGTTLNPTIATVDVTDLSSFTAYFPEISPNDNSSNILVNVVYNFKTPSDSDITEDGNFPVWPPFISGYTAFAEATYPIALMESSGKLMTMVLDIPFSELTEIDFSRLHVNKLYKNDKFYIDFESDSPGLTIPTYEIDKNSAVNLVGTVTATIRTSNEDLFGSSFNGEPPITCTVGNSTNSIDFAKYVREINLVYPMMIPPNFANNIVLHLNNSEKPKNKRTIIVSSTNEDNYNNGIVSIGHHAFSNMTNLESLTFYDTPDGLKIDDNAFENCVEFSNFIYNNKDDPNILTLPIEGDFLELGSNVFSGNTNVLSLEFSGCPNIFSIPDFAFAGMNNLKFIDFAQIMDIGNSSFENCNALKEVTLTKNIREIDNCAFKNCNSLVSVIIPSSIKKLTCGKSVFLNEDDEKRMNISAANIVENATPPYNGSGKRYDPILSKISVYFCGTNARLDNLVAKTNFTDSSTCFGNGIIEFTATADNLAYDTKYSLNKINGKILHFIEE